MTEVSTYVAGSTVQAEAVNEKISTYVDEKMSRISFEMQHLEQRQCLILEQQQELDHAITLAKARTHLVIERVSLSTTHDYAAAQAALDKAYALLSDIYDSSHYQNKWANLQTSFEVVRQKLQYHAPDAGIAIDNLVSQLW